MLTRHLLQRWLVRAGWALAGIVAAGLYLYYLQAQSLPDLEFWHREDVAATVVPELQQLDNIDLHQYQEHENRIFADLDTLIEYRNADLPGWHRYSAVAHAIYREAWPESNRTLLRQPANKRGAALLVHGLSDSTHSMRALEAALFEAGFETLNLRMPGHGTLPGALQNVTWRQYRDAYRLGVRALVSGLAPEQPLLLVGYSNGAALAVDYTVDALTGQGLRVPDQLILLSPAMQVTPMAAYARIQRWVAELPGMEKLGWTDVVAEFDPFKYNSFPVYAGEQIYRITSDLEDKLSRLSEGELARFPPLIAFQSVLDATIPPTSVLTGLLDYLQGTPAELVLFDVNRRSAMLPLLADRGDNLLHEAYSRDPSKFGLSVVGSGTDTTGSELVTVRKRDQGQNGWVEEVTAMRWPNNVYSLSHVALPFASDDRVYGSDQGDGLIRLGEIWFKGERNGFGVPLGLLARQRYNPFFPYVRERVLGAVLAD